MGRLTDAFVLATIMHEGQIRKGTNIPYISHLMSVSALVMEYGGDEEDAIAGLLHDLLEDVGGHFAPVVLQRFGEKVSRIVQDCTDGLPDANGQKTDWHMRKRNYIQHLSIVQLDSLRISACDKLHNARTILLDFRIEGPKVFARFSAGQDATLWYYREVANVVMKRLPGSLAEELDRTVSALELAVKSW